MDIIGESTLTTLQLPASITADGNSAGVDCRNLIGKGAIVMTARNTAGTNPTMAVKLQASADANVVASVTPGTNTGTGTCTQVKGGPDAVAEDITITFTSATAFGVSGATSGAGAAGTVGTLYSNAVIEFMITAGGAAFVNGDTIVIATTARTWADVTGGAFTALAATSKIYKLPLDFDTLPRYLRLNYDIGGTVSPAFTLGIFAQSLTN
jgi:hypothetical protein